MHDQANVHQVLANFHGSTGGDPWVVDALARGKQATLYQVHPRDRQPCDAARSELVVKLYDSRRTHTDVLREEYQALAILNRLAAGSRIGGWTVESPVALFLCENPPAIVLSKVSGTPLDRCVEQKVMMHGTATGTLIEGWADAVACVLAAYWNDSESMYGDIHLENILCDFQRKTLTFVDPGKPDQRYLCADVAREFYPASRDLGYLLFEISISVAQSLGRRPYVAQRRIEFVTRVICQYMSREQLHDRRDIFLEEVAACTRCHLKMLGNNGFWSPRSLWAQYLARAASGKAKQILNALQSDPGRIKELDRLSGECHEGGLVGAPLGHNIPVCGEAEL